MFHTYLDVLGQPFGRDSGIAFVQRRGYRVERWSCRRTAETASRFARELEARGIGKGDRVMIWGENCAEWVAAFFGCLLRGAVVVPMDHTAAPDFAHRVAAQVRARLLVCSRQHSPPDADRAPPPGALRSAWAPPPGALRSAWPARLVLEELPETLAAHSGAPYPPVQVSPQDKVEIVFTSGTTAEPRGVILTHRNIVANLAPLAAEIARYRKYERPFHPLRFLCLLPLSHVFGQFLGIFVPQLLRGVTVFQDSLNPAEVIHRVRAERVSVLAAVPRQIEALRHKIERDFGNGLHRNLAAAAGEHFLKRWWRFRRVHAMFGWKFWAIVSGGATLDAATEAFWTRLGFAVVQGYGMTETTSVVSVNHPFRLGRGSIGKVLPGREVKLAADGEILVRGDSVAAGYWTGAEEAEASPAGGVAGAEEASPAGGVAAPQETASGGWLRTGDLGEMDAAGNLYFKGRSKNVIVSPEGMNIHPEDLEAALRPLPEVRDCVVVGLDVEGNARPCAVLILHGADADGASVVRRANESLAAHQQIRRWHIWPGQDFPRTSTGKPRTGVIREAVEDALGGGSPERKLPDVGRGKATEAGGPERKLRAAGAPERKLRAAGPGETGALADLVAQVTGHSGPEHSLRVAGAPSAPADLSSLERVELLSAIEDRYQVDLDEARFSEAATLADLEQLVRSPAVRREQFQYPRWPQRWPVTWLRAAAYYLLVWPATMLLAKPAIIGRENLRGVRGPVLVVSNHIASVDVGFVLAALPRRFRRLAIAMEGERLRAMRRAISALVVALFNVFPLPQKSGFRASFAFAGESLDRGYSILVFPEGHMTADGKMAPFREGIGILANSLAIPLVPIRIDGLFELKQAGRRFARPGAVRVSIGPPVRFERGADPARIARELEARVAAAGR